MLNTLISDLQSPDPLVRVKVTPALGNLGAAALRAIPSLLSLTQNESQHPLIRVMAAAAVSKIDPNHTGAVISVLANALNSDDAPIQGAAADELGALGKQAESALPALFNLLGDDCAAVRSTAAQAIWKITGDRRPAERVGRELLRSEDWLTRQVGGSLLGLLEDEETELIKNTSRRNLPQRQHARHPMAIGPESARIGSMGNVVTQTEIQ